jgi:hypothetical protein
MAELMGATTAVAAVASAPVRNERRSILVIWFSAEASPAYCSLSEFINLVMNFLGLRKIRVPPNHWQFKEKLEWREPRRAEETIRVETRVELITFRL